MTGREFAISVLLTLFAIAFLVGHIGIREGALFFGEGGVLASIFSGWTVLGVLVAGGAAWQSYRASQETLKLGIESELSGRFLVACEMVGSSKRSVSAAGIMTAVEVAAAHGKYLQPTLGLLVGHIMDQDRDAYNAVRSYQRTKLLERHVEMPFSTKEALWAFRATGLLFKDKFGRAGVVPAEEAFILTEALLHNGLIKECNFGGAYVDAICGALSFMNCGIINSDLHFAAIGELHFVGVRLDGASIQIVDVREALTEGDAKRPLVRMRGCVGAPKHFTVDSVDATISPKVLWE